MKHFSFQIPLYSGSKKSALHVLTANTEKDWNKAIEFIHSFADEPEELFEWQACAAFTCSTTSKKFGTHFWILFSKAGVSFNTIGHEATHLKNHIFISRGLQLDLHNDEAEAYLLGWIIESITTKLKPRI